MILAETAAGDVIIAAIAAVPATIVAWATYAKVKRAGAAVSALNHANTSQHKDTAKKLDVVADRQQWVINQIADLRQSLLDHVLWEEGTHADRPGKYHDLEQRLAALEDKEK